MHLSRHVNLCYLYGDKQIYIHVFGSAHYTAFYLHVDKGQNEFSQTNICNNLLQSTEYSF